MKYIVCARQWGTMMRRDTSSFCLFGTDGENKYLSNSTHNYETRGVPKTMLGKLINLECDLVNRLPQKAFLHKQCLH